MSVWTPARLGRSFGAAFVVLTFVPPLLLLVSGSLRAPGLPPPPRPELVPDPVSVQGYTEAVELGGLLRASLNSLAVAAVAVPVSVLVAALAGYALTRLSRRLAGLVAAASLAALMVPATALLVPKFAIFRTLGWTDTLVPLMMPALLGISPLYPLVYYLAFRARSPGASGSGWPWPGPWSANRTCSCSTSHCPTWTSSCGRRPGAS